MREVTIIDKQQLVLTLFNDQAKLYERKNILINPVVVTAHDVILKQFGRVVEKNGRTRLGIDMNAQEFNIYVRAESIPVIVRTINVVAGMGISSSNSIPALLAYIIVFVSSNGEGDGVRNVLIPVHGVVLTSILYKLLLLLVASNNVGVVKGMIIIEFGAKFEGNMFYLFPIDVDLSKYY
ncbi:MAG: hypothetical protein EZS28_004275 [Streblomastix strix]|uniref:Uncharacterized protein n=1 Tax=Streblomastix strix TaxID=222440 RepID=A0A5J4WYL1_9EUKA|nr:MAG: hypothetical protein EZS28_004275 [Streblomastix strix]